MTEDEIYKKIYQDALLITGLDDTPQNKFTVDSMINDALVYCCREDIPTRMITVLTKITVDLLKSGSTSDAKLKRIKEGDREEEYFEDSTSVFSYQSLLDAFRKIKAYKE